MRGERESAREGIREGERVGEREEGRGGERDGDGQYTRAHAHAFRQGARIVSTILSEGSVQVGASVRTRAGDVGRSSVRNALGIRESLSWSERAVWGCSRGESEHVYL